MRCFARQDGRQSEHDLNWRLWNAGFDVPRNIYIHTTTHINYTHTHTHNKYIQDKPYVQAYTPSPTVLLFEYVLRLNSIAQKHTGVLVYPSVCSVISYTVFNKLTPYSMEQGPS